MQTQDRACYWSRVSHKDPRAVAMADRHYSRQTPGSPEFTRPGHKIVLMHFLANGTPAALWAAHRPAPSSGIARADGLDAWDCALFRIEHRTVAASELIKEATRITRSIWQPIPTHGYITTIDPRHVAPVYDPNGRAIYGYSYLRARWQFLRITKRRKLIMLQYPAHKLERIAPIVWRYARAEFGNVAQRTRRPQPDNQNMLF